MNFLGRVSFSASQSCFLGGLFLFGSVLIGSSGFVSYGTSHLKVVPLENHPAVTDVSFVQEKDQDKQDKQKGQAKEKFSAKQLEFFEKKIRPVLVEHCYSCHSTDAKSLQASLQCDSRAALLEGGDSGEAIVPGKADESLLIESLKYESYEMPPKGKLPDSVIEDFEKWVNMGAPWPKEADPGVAASKEEFDVKSRKESHWAWQPIADPTIPEVATKQWAQQPLDHFILKRLESQGLKPAGKNDRTSIARRLYFDLTGLPPTPAEIKSFLDDKSENATEKLIDQLLASPKFGERWARHWLDLVRYAESRGHEFDNDAPNAFQYRDYVIRAFNADVPYDQLVREHLAGDLLQNPRLNPKTGFNESILGTGFWFLGEWVHAPVDILKDESDRFDNMIDVTSKTFLGMTVSCARCHDHKFDAISLDDYYSMTGFLHSAEYRQVRFESMIPNKKVSKEFAGFDFAANRRLQVKLAKLLDRNQDSAVKFLTKLPAEKKEDKAKPSKAVKNPGKGKKKVAKAKKKVIRAAKRVTGAADGREAGGLTVLVDYGSLAPNHFFQDGFSFRNGPLNSGFLMLGTSDAQVKAVEHPAAVSDPAWNGLQSESESIVTDRSMLRHLPRSGRTLYSPKFPVTTGHVSALVRGGGHFVACVDSHRMIAGPLHTNTVKTIKDNNQGELRWVTFNLSRYNGHNVQLEFSPLKGSQIEVLQIVEGDPRKLPYQKVPRAKQVFQKGDAESIVEQVIEAYALGKSLNAQQAFAVDRLIGGISAWTKDQSWKEEVSKLQVIRTAIAKKIVKKSRLAMAMIDSTGEEARVMIRGNSSKLGKVVPRRFLSALDGTGGMEIPTGSGRLELARRINAADNPLTSRVIVNRVWHHMIGRGIVPTTDNFGVLGMQATHPQLLDHLATWFNQNGKSIKKLVKYIASSGVYQMSGKFDAKSMEKDPGNQLYHYNPPKRLQGEAIRDTLLNVAGKLNGKMYGPPVAIHLTPFMTGRGRPGKSGPLNGNGRRSVYIAVRRNFVSPFQLAFDMPVPFSSMGRRNVSNVPAQALILLNHPLVLKCAEDLAKRAIKEHPENAKGRIEWLYQTVFARAPSQNEIRLAMGFVKSENQKDELKNWTALSHTLFNVKEFIYLK